MRRTELHRQAIALKAEYGRLLQPDQPRTETGEVQDRLEEARQRALGRREPAAQLTFDVHA